MLNDIFVSWNYVDMKERKCKTAHGKVIDLSLVGSSRIKLSQDYKNRKAGAVVSVPGKLLKFL